MLRNTFVILCACLAIASRCIAADTASMRPDITSNVQTATAFEKQIREIAEKTVADEKISNGTDVANEIDPEPLDSAIPEIKAPDTKIPEAKVPLRNLGKSNPGDPLRIFKYRKNGTVVFADSAPSKTYYEVIVYNSCYACNVHSKVDWRSTRLYLTEFSDPISQASRQYNVEEAFIRAIIHAESAFNPLARSRKGAMGLMQLMPTTAQDMGVRDATSPIQNIQGGVKYLAYLLQTFNGNQILAAAAYNAGPGAVTRHGGIPPYEETQTYVKRVKILSDRYKNQKILATN